MARLPIADRVRACQSDVGRWAFSHGWCWPRRRLQCGGSPTFLDPSPRWGRCRREEQPQAVSLRVRISVYAVAESEAAEWEDPDYRRRFPGAGRKLDLGAGKKETVEVAVAKSGEEQ